MAASLFLPLPAFSSNKEHRLNTFLSHDQTRLTGRLCLQINKLTMVADQLDYLIQSNLYLQKLEKLAEMG